MIFSLFLAMLLIFLPEISRAQTCTPTAVPTTPLRNNTVNQGTTCGGEAGLNLGGTIYAHPSKVFEFTAQNANMVLTLSAGSTDIEMSLVTGCTSAPIFIGFVGGPMAAPPGSLVNGTKYFIVVSKDPSLPPLPAPGQCGNYNFTVIGTQVPVALQKFSVE